MKMNTTTDYQLHGFDTSRLPEEEKIALVVKVFRTKTESARKTTIPKSESLEE